MEDRVKEMHSRDRVEIRQQVNKLSSNQQDALKRLKARSWPGAIAPPRGARGSGDACAFPP